MPYTPHTADEIREMLDVVGAADIDELFRTIPEAVRVKDGLNLPDGLCEEEVARIMSNLAARNTSQADCASFLGGGVYDSFIPAAVDALSSRSEFLTAYTPYQAEVSQGTLQVIYEWQTYICRLTGLPVANASMYDGATALAEACLVAAAKSRRPKVVLPALLNPRYRSVVETSLAGQGIEIVTAPATADGVTDAAGLEDLAADAGAVVLQSPNYLGRVEPVMALGAAAKSGGALLVAAANPVSLSLLRAPAEYGADLAVGEAQPFGVPCSCGGPLIGYMACSDALKRVMPGRIVGRTTDGEGRQGYVLTLQTREQHIRREKATSNICSNQGLNATRAAVYLSLLGTDGFRDLGEANHARCEAFRAMAAGIPGVELPFDGPVFNEVVIRLPRPAAEFRAFARERGILAGIPLAGFADCAEGDLLVALTERRTAGEIDLYGQVLRDFLGDREGR